MDHSAVQEIAKQENAAAYTGPERRWMKSREWSDWTDRMAQHDVVWAAKEAREAAILTKLYNRATKKGRTEEASAIWSGLWLLRDHLKERRERIAAECSTWFDGSAFAAPERIAS